MTNFERYKEEILEIANKDEHIAICAKTHSPILCTTSNCNSDGCIFFKDYPHCVTQLTKWMYERYKPAVILEKFEKEAFFRMYVQGFRYIARDKHDRVYAFTKEPEKKKGFWINTDEFLLVNSEIIDCRFLSPEDEEPMLIKDLIGEYYEVDKC